MTDEPRRVTETGITGASVVSSGSILMKTHLWIWWANIAIDHELEAQEAHTEAIALTVRGEGFGETLERETYASLIAVSAAAHAIDALYGAVKQIKPLSGGSPRWSSILHLFKTAFEIRGSAGGGTWAAQFEWLFDLRDGAVHYDEKFAAPVPHPAGTNVGVESATYSAAAATRAVNLLLEVVETCISNPRQELKEWAGRLTHVPPSLSGRRQSRDTGSA